jgi:hypothetical protein
MKIQELLNEETKKEYFERLTKSLNISKLGSGTYATVFSHPLYHNVAVKYVENDPKYMKFIRFCLDHQDNPWLPKIIHIQKVKMDDEIYDTRKKWDRILERKAYIIFFQKLRKATFLEIASALDDMLSDIPDSKFEVDRGFERERFYYRYFSRLEPEDWKMIAKLSKQPAVKQVAQLMVSLGAVDFHNENVMMRDEGGRSQLVFTDPVAS